jgi:L-lactate dehydrogenase complex protein LldG
MSAARNAMLKRVRTALRDVPSHEQPMERVGERGYRVTSSASRAELVGQFVARVREYKAVVHVVPAAELPQAIADACAARGIQRLLIPADVPPAWRPAGVTVVADDGLSYGEIDGCDGVVTGCALGIAQTGTIVLDGGPAQGRRVVTLLPDYHLCIVAADQLVGLVPEAMAKLAPAVREAQRPITLISGPSATSDIELNRVEGVHGPRTLEVIVVDS